jgi:hypothetical protein
MKIVEQKNKSIDCGVCCLAMLANISYEDASKALFGKSGIQRRTFIKDIRKGLKKHKLSISVDFHFKECFPASKFDLIGIKKNAIVKTKNIGNHDYWHWLVWDGKKQILIDPERKGKKPKRKLAAVYIVT